MKNYDITIDRSLCFEKILQMFASEYLCEDGNTYYFIPRVFKEHEVVGLQPMDFEEFPNDLKTELNFLNNENNHS